MDKLARYVSRVLLLAVAYYFAAKLGLTFDPVGGFATFVWPPSGIALAALLLFGFDLWPGVLLGAFYINYQTSAPPLVALGIAAGNTLEVFFGAYFIKRFFDFNSSLRRIKDVLALIIVA